MRFLFFVYLELIIDVSLLVLSILLPLLCCYVCCLFRVTKMITFSLICIKLKNDLIVFWKTFPKCTLIAETFLF